MMAEAVTKGIGTLARWGPVTVAVLLDVAFVQAWWAFVYFPGDDLVAVRDVEPLRFNDTEVRAVRQLAPDGACALVGVGTAADLKWRLVDWARVEPGDIAAAVAGRGTLQGRIVAAASIAGCDEVVAIMDQAGKLSAWRWRAGKAPSHEGTVKDGAWIDDRGNIRPASALKRSIPGASLGYVGNFVVNQGTRSFERLSRFDGTAMGSHGKSQVPGHTGAWSSNLIYESPKSSTARILRCDPQGVDCDERTLGVKWGSGASAVAWRAGDGVLAVCREGVVHLFQTDLDEEGVKGIRLGTFDAVMGCDDLHWLPRGQLYVAGKGGARVWDLEDRP